MRCSVLSPGSFVKGCVGFVSHTIGRGCVYYVFIEGEHCIVVGCKAFGELLDIAVKPYAKKRFAFEYVFNQLFAVHIDMFVL